MARTTAIAVLMFLLLPLCLPLDQAKSEASLPACCRGNGKHRCSMMARFRPSNQDQSTGPAVRSANEPCPYGSMLFAPAAPYAIGVPARAASSARPVPYPAVILQAVLQARISEARSHHKRGPPPFLA